MKKSMVDCYGYQYFMDLSSSCMELEGGQEGVDFSLEI